MASALTAAEISAAVSAVTTAVVGSLVNWGSRIPVWVQQVLPDDHSALRRSFRGLSSVTSNSNLLPILVAAGPSRRLARDGFDPDVAVPVIAARFGSDFTQPDYSSLAQGMRYQVKAADSSGDLRRQLHLSPSGTIALDWTVEIDSLDATSGLVELPVLEVLRPLLMLLLFVRGGAYDEMFRRRRLRWRRRFDWYFTVAGNVRIDAQQNYWVPKFPGRQARRAANQMPNSPLLGFASPELRSWPTTSSWQPFARTALRGFLQDNGFHDVDDAIEDTIMAATTTVVPEIEAAMGLSFDS